MFHLRLGRGKFLRILSLIGSSFCRADQNASLFFTLQTLALHSLRSTTMKQKCKFFSVCIYHVEGRVQLLYLIREGLWKFNLSVTVHLGASARKKKSIFDSSFIQYVNDCTFLDQQLNWVHRQKLLLFTKLTWLQFLKSFSMLFGGELASLIGATAFVPWSSWSLGRISIRCTVG